VEIVRGAKTFPEEGRKANAEEKIPKRNGEVLGKGFDFIPGCEGKTTPSQRIIAWARPKEKERKEYWKFARLGSISIKRDHKLGISHLVDHQRGEKGKRAALHVQG